MSQSTTTTTTTTVVIPEAMAPMVKQCGITLCHVDETKPTLKRKIREEEADCEFAARMKKIKKDEEKEKKVICNLFRYTGYIDYSSEGQIEYGDCTLIADVGDVLKAGFTFDSITVDISESVSSFSNKRQTPICFYSVDLDFTKPSDEYEVTSMDHTEDCCHNKPFEENEDEE